MKNILKKFDIKKLLLFAGMVFIFLTIDYILIIGYAVINNVNKLSLNETIVFIFIKYFILIVLFIIHYHKYLKEKFFDFFKNFRKYSAISFKYWFIGFLIMIASNMIINSFISGLGKNEEGVQLLISKIPVIAFILTTIMAPFVEEMIFRKYLQDSVKNKKLFMILSGLIFGFIHVVGFSNPWEYLLIIPYGALGFMFAKTLNETDNIYTTIMVHMFHNGVLTFISIFL